MKPPTLVKYLFNMNIFAFSNNKSRPIFGIAIGCLLILLLAWAAWSFSLHKAGPAFTPELRFSDIHGLPVIFGSEAKHPILLTFWSTTCTPCRAEIPHLKTLQQQWGPHGLEVIAVAMYYDRPDAVINLAKQQNLNYRVALDPNDSTARAFGGVSQTPAHFLISADGRIVQRWVGNRSMSEMHGLISAIIPNAMTATNYPPGAH